MNESDLFEVAIADIQSTYESGPWNLGWRFLYCSRKTLSPDTRYMLLGLNPGGEKFGVNASVERGNAYRVERDWSNDGEQLQHQVQALCRKVFSAFEEPRRFEKAFDATLTANLVPFRSPTWDKLPAQDKALEFSRQLWADLLAEISPSVIICLGRKPQKFLTQYLRKIGYDSSHSESIPTGWGDHEFDLVTLDGDGNCMTVAYVPHLSRFKLMGRKESERPTTAFANRLAELSE